MATMRIRAEDMVGIGIAVMTHIALLAWLVLRKEPEPPPPVKSVTVTLQGPIAAEAGSPSREEAAAAIAPKLGEEPAPPAAAEPVVPEPQRATPPSPAPQPKPAPPRPQPKALAPPVPAPRAQPRPLAPVPKAAAPRPSRIGDNFLPPQPKGAPAGQRKPAGASRIGDNFLPGAPSGNGKAETPPGPAITSQIRSSLVSEVARQLKPKWQQPSGLEVDKLATTIEWDLGPDGALIGAPRFVSQTGVTPANKPQADRHREQAIRAVRLAQPFRLPPQFYAGWKRLRFTFDWKLN